MRGVGGGQGPLAKAAYPQAQSGGGGVTLWLGLSRPFWFQMSGQHLTHTLRHISFLSIFWAHEMDFSEISFYILTCVRRPSSLPILLTFA